MAPLTCTFPLTDFTGSVDGALAAADAGCDFVIAQGVEAGGHVRGTTPLRELLAAVVGKVSIPVVTAGGIATAGHVAAAIGTRAAAVRAGTRFVATEESLAHPAYIAALLSARSAQGTMLTTTFGGGWPDAPHRVLRSAVAAAEAFDSVRASACLFRVPCMHGASQAARFSPGPHWAQGLRG